MGKRAVVLSVAALALFACKKSQEPAAAGAEPDPTPPSEVEASATSQAPEGPIDWLEGDYDAALARASAAKLPLVVDLWAAWCHTCLAMKHSVLIDPGLADLADRFVWVAIDTEKPENADVIAKLPIDTWPTFYVVSPDGAVQARQIGASSVKGFREFVLRGERGHLAARDASGDLGLDTPLGQLREAERAHMADDLRAADKAYSRALDLAPADWDRRSDALLGQLSTLVKAGHVERCARLGRTGLDAVAARHGPQVADFIILATQCATADPTADVESYRKRATAVLETVLADDAAPLSKDDRSEALRVMRELAVQSGDEGRARGYAERQRKLIDEAVASASTAYEAMTFDYHRPEVYLFLGRGAEMVPWLEELTKKLPTEYDPPYRLAGLLTKLGRHDDAAEAARLALSRAPEGPRKARMYRVLADIEKSRGDVEAERAARQKVVDLYAELPAARKSEGADERARAALEAVGTKSP